MPPQRVHTRMGSRRPHGIANSRCRGLADISACSVNQVDPRSRAQVVLAALLQRKRRRPAACRRKTAPRIAQCGQCRSASTAVQSLPHLVGGTTPLENLPTLLALRLLSIQRVRAGKWTPPLRRPLSLWLPDRLSECNSSYRSIRASILEHPVVDIQKSAASGVHRWGDRSVSNRDYTPPSSELASCPDADITTRC
jgi:hypothetical protein